MTKRKSVFDDFDRIEKISSGEYISESGEVLFVRSKVDEATGRRASSIVIMKLTTGEEQVITAGGFGEGSPKLSPDGKQVLFISGVKGLGRQLFVFDRATGETRRITNMRFGLFDPLWSPDGKKILFTSMAADGMDEAWLQTPVDPAEEAKYALERAKEPVVITDFGYKFDGLGFRKPEVMQLWVASIDGGSAKRITAGDCNFMHANWSPDSRNVICESSLFCDKEESLAIDLLLIDIETKEMTRLTQDRMIVSYPNPVRPVYTPDGKYIIAGILDYRKDKKSESYPACVLHRISADGSELTPIFHQTEECFDSVQFAYNANCGAGLEKVRISSDGQHVLFHSGSRGAGHIFKVAIYGDDHTPVLMTPGKYAYSGMGNPSCGKVLVARTETNVPEAYYLMDEETGDTELLVQSAADMLASVDFSRAEDFFFDTLDGESSVHGFMLPPEGAKPGEKYPTILYVHGGPHPFYTYGFDLEMQCFAGAGFGVIYCNPRGSSGYGDVHRNMKRAFDGSAYTDIMQFVSEACRRADWIDPERIGMTGGSYGGYMTNYVAAHTKRFKAFISQRSVVNDLIGCASSDMQGSSKGYGSMEEFMVHELERSTVCGAQNITAPFLILHGEDDYRCPVEGAHQLFVALKDTHAEDFPIKMILYPHCGHEQPSDPAQRRHYYAAMLDWFKKYL